jgi:hypothetical protein
MGREEFQSFKPFKTFKSFFGHHSARSLFTLARLREREG